ncbi:MAG: hypothetical protein R2799_00520 [Crocinitomicaceae bacterium]
MNKFVNFLSVIVLIPAAFLAFAIKHELEFWPEKNAAHIPFQTQIYTGVFAFILLINLFRIYQKWSVIRAFWKIDSFIIKVPVEKSWYTSKSVSNWLEALFAIAFGYFFAQNAELTRNLGLALLLFGLENIFYILWVRSKNLYAVAVNKKALILLDRQLSGYYFHGLRKMEKDFDQIYFEYMTDLQLKFPLKSLSKENQKLVIEKVLENINHDKVYVDQDLV